MCHFQSVMNELGSALYYLLTQLTLPSRLFDHPLCFVGNANCSRFGFCFSHVSRAACNRFSMVIIFTISFCGPFAFFCCIFSNVFFFFTLWGTQKVTNTHTQHRERMKYCVHKKKEFSQMENGCNRIRNALHYNSHWGDSDWLAVCTLLAPSVHTIACAWPVFVYVSIGPKVIQLWLIKKSEVH